MDMVSEKNRSQNTLNGGQNMRYISGILNPIVDPCEPLMYRNRYCPL